MAGRRSDCARARGGGRSGLRPFASARLRASVLRQSGAPILLPGADCSSKVQLVETRCGPRREHEVVTAMDKTRGLEGSNRVDHIEPATNLRNQLLDRPNALAATQHKRENCVNRSGTPASQTAPNTPGTFLTVSMYAGTDIAQ